MAATTTTQTPDRLDVSMSLPSWTGIALFGGGIVVFLLVSFLLKKFSK